MDKIKSLKVKQADGTLGPAIALGADAANVDMADGSTVEAAMAKKQATLVSGTNIKTINNNSILGSGNINLVTDLSNYYNKTEVNDLISNLSSLDLQVVTTLPTSNISSSTIYLIAREDGDAQNIYEEYIYINNTWEMIGTTEVDTSTFDEVYVGSDTPTSESVEIWINPDGTADSPTGGLQNTGEDTTVDLAAGISSTASGGGIAYGINAHGRNGGIGIGQDVEGNGGIIIGIGEGTSANGGISIGGEDAEEGQLIIGSSYIPIDEPMIYTSNGLKNITLDTYTKAEIDAKFTALASQYVKQVNGTTTALWMGTQEQYDAIATKDATTTYIIQGTTE